jgi:hypothetical protein
MTIAEAVNQARAAHRLSFAIATVVVFATLLAARPAGASPIFFTIGFTQNLAAPAADGPPTGHFSIDDSLLDTGVTQYVRLNAIPDFDVMDDGADFPASLWTGFLRVPASGRALRIQGLSVDDPGSNAIAEFLLGSNDPRCLGVVASTPTHCEAALGAGVNVTTWAIVSFDAQQNLAVASGTYEVPEPAVATSLALGMLMLRGRLRSRRTPHSAE